ncbi:MAG: adenosylcobinamide-GDP ribazoletransferase [Firmicutes bacterium HGW-Firmicutes-8]|nr:MAG: adenosylcobinamide-GDP ribazoletransferase [Firmicutes bacterium HGW-Firmicutes-8]
MFASFVFALQMLTRIQIGSPVFEERRFGRGTVFFPIIGIILGAVLYIIHFLTAGRFPDLVRGAFIFAAMVILTGGMHADGLMDSMDALFSGRDRKKKLEILKDVHVGAFGVVTLVTVYILKYALITGLCGTSRIGWLFIFPTTARWGMVYVIRFFPYLWEEGLGKAFARHTGNVEFGLATVFLGLTAAVFWSWPGFIGLLGLAFLVHLWGWGVTRTLGGVTGDIYGATAELLEVATLLCLYIIPSNI